MKRLSISIRSHHRGQSTVEMLLVGPIIAVFLLAATKVGQYYYALSTSESISYTNSMTFSSYGQQWYASLNQVKSPTRYWDGEMMTIAHPGSVSGAPNVFNGKCLATYTIYFSNLGLLNLNPGDSGNPLASYEIFGVKLDVYSTSVSFRPLYGGYPVWANSGYSCTGSDDKWLGVY